MSVLSAILPPSAGAAMHDAWRWWLSELRAMVPAGLAARRKPAPYSDIVLTPDGIVIDRVRDGVGERLAEENPIEALDEESWAELAALIEGARARIILSTPDIFAVTFTFPAAARRRLKSAVALQLGQIAPMEPALLAWNSEIVSAGKDKIVAEIVMARQSRIDALEALFEEHGIPSPPIFAMAGDRTIRLTRGFDGSRGPWQGRNGRAWLFAALLLASIPLTIFLGASMLTSFTESRIAAVQQELAPRLKAEREAAEAEALRHALKPLFDGPSATETIESVALAMPDTAFATEMGRDASGALRFIVEAGDTEALSETVAKAPLLANASPADMNPSPNGRMRVSYVTAMR